MRQQLSDDQFHQFSAEILSGMHEWRQQHPRASFRAIEDELDARWARVRASMLEQLALSSAATTWSPTTDADSPTCPTCASPLHERGKHSRTLQTHGGQTLTLDRSYGVCPLCQTGLFPPG